MSPVRVDLQSDTKSRPTPAMRKAMAEAEVGDEQAGEDPSINLLCRRVAALLGKEAAVFLPSGIMCNQVAILTHCQPGDEILADEFSHIFVSEGAGAAVLAGAQIRPLRGTRGMFTAADVEAALRPAGKRNAPRSRLVEVEQTANRGGGAVWPLAQLQEVGGAARAHGLRSHMDGARLLNAVVASGVPAAEQAAPFDSVWLDLSKGLGCPVGGVLAGSAEFIDAAWRWKTRLGGAMRQSGILAAAGLHALDHHVERLADDHANAKVLARRLAQIPGVRLDPPEVETNLVFFDIAETGWKAPQLESALRARGIRMGSENQRRLRAVTHLDVTRAGVEEAGEAVADILRGAPPTA
ncbi:MAG: aminotransferase class I/II-fold pyridoxal phosphate-dependent enzyme [Alphaproteobacteria bacterium]|nr:aminotransferase class I/II-fold pyridoxal phosphate-dependent enzyme [Alphaproteobacteria bacterium]